MSEVCKVHEDLFLLWSTKRMTGSPDPRTVAPPASPCTLGGVHIHSECLSAIAKNVDADFE